MACPRTYYNYDALPEGSIRLLKILPATKSGYTSVAWNPSLHPIEEQLEISLETFDVSECPPYMALSYTWSSSGSLVDPKPSIFTKIERVYPLFCQDSILLATWNLRSFLRQVRKGFDFFGNDRLTADNELLQNGREAFAGAQYLWADALCINQNDLAERSSQVKLMSEIYRAASRTLVWLGEKDELSADGIAALSMVGKNLEEAHQLARAQPGTPIHVKPVGLDAKRRIACAALLARNWFSRYWIVQEVLLSKRILVLFGSAYIPFEFFERARTLRQLTAFAATAGYEGEKTSDRDMTYLARARENIHTLGFMESARSIISEGKMLDFVFLKRACCAQNCSDPRDRIYSLLAMCSEFHLDGQLLLQPDYTQSVEHVYIEATALVIKRRSDVAVLDLISSKRTTPNLPSWCPDYVASETGVTALTEFSLPARFDGVPESTYDICSNRLPVFGQCIGVVNEICRVSDKSGVASQSDKSWISTGPGAICSILSRLGTRHHSDEFTMPRQSLIEILWRTFLGYFKGCWGTLASWEEKPLPSGAALFLPQFLRLFLFVYLDKETHDDNKGNHSRSSSKTDKARAIRYGEIFETALRKIIAIEPSARPFLPKPSIIAEMCSAYDPDSQWPATLFIALSSARAEMDAMQKRAKRLGLDLPASFTDPSEVQLGIHTLSQAYGKAGDWWVGFTNSMIYLYETIVFRTDSSLFGLAKCEMQEGDEIWILDGAYSPVCLRKNESGNYRFVGKLRMHGLMEDEGAKYCKKPTSIVIE